MDSIECRRRTFVEYTIPTGSYRTDLKSPTEITVVEVTTRNVMRLRPPVGASTLRFYDRYVSDPLVIDGQAMECSGPIIESFCSQRQLLAVREISVAELSEEISQGQGNTGTQGRFGLYWIDASGLLASARQVGCETVVLTNSGYWVAPREDDLFLYEKVTTGIHLSGVPVI